MEELKSCMEDSYVRIESIFEREVKQKGFVTMPNTISFSVNTHEFSECIQILNDCGRNLRGKDGVPKRATLSIPISIKDIFVLGIKYQKRNDTLTEDHFTFEPDKPPEPYYKGKMQKLLTEYKDTHKRQSDY
jgi:hypothetical protein